MIRSPAGFGGEDRIKRYLDYYQPSYGVMMLSAGQAFSPASLFAAGEQGVWYDPSDFTTMFQDSAGTTPVTAVEQPVGLLLDKSQGLTLGPERVTNGDFSNGSTGYVEVLNGTISYATGAMVATGITGNTGVYQDVPVVSGKSYQVSWLIGTSTNWRINIYNGASFTTSLYNNGTGSSSSGAFTAVVFPTTTAIRVYAHTGTGTVATFDNISVKLLSGNHATQSTSASRPVLSARVNQLTYSEDFSNTAWVKGAGATATVSVLSTLAGTGNHWTFRNGVANGTQTFSVEAKAGTVSWMAMGQGNTGAAFNTFFNLSTGSLGTVASGQTASILNVGDGWYLCTITLNFTTTNASIAVTNADNVAASWNAAGTENINIRKADLRVTNDGVGIPAYQRVNTSTDYDTTGFPYYLRFDGTDDSMATGTITPGTDKAQVFAGVRKQSDAALAVMVETGIDVTSASYPGSLAVFAPSGAGVTSYQPFFRGTTGRVFETVTPFASPITNVLTFLMSNQLPAAGDAIQSRANGVAVTATESSNITTAGNFLAYPLYIGSRAGSSLRFNGRVYSLIVRFGANLDATTITNTETWVNGKTYAYA